MTIKCAFAETGGNTLDFYSKNYLSDKEFIYKIRQTIADIGPVGPSFGPVRYSNDAAIDGLNVAIKSGQLSNEITNSNISLSRATMGGILEEMVKGSITINPIVNSSVNYAPPVNDLLARTKEKLRGLNISLCKQLSHAGANDPDFSSALSELSAAKQLLQAYFVLIAPGYFNSDPGSYKAFFGGSLLMDDNSYFALLQQQIEKFLSKNKTTTDWIFSEKSMNLLFKKSKPHFPKKTSLRLVTSGLPTWI